MNSVTNPNSALLSDADLTRMIRDWLPTTVRTILPRAKLQVPSIDFRGPPDLNPRLEVSLIVDWDTAETADKTSTPTKDTATAEETDSGAVHEQGDNSLTDFRKCVEKMYRTRSLITPEYRLNQSSKPILRSELSLALERGLTGARETEVNHEDDGTCFVEGDFETNDDAESASGRVTTGTVFIKPFACRKITEADHEKSKAHDI